MPISKDEWIEAYEKNSDWHAWKYHRMTTFAKGLEISTMNIMSRTLQFPLSDEGVATLGATSPKLRCFEVKVLEEVKRWARVVTINDMELLRSIEGQMGEQEYGEEADNH
ncbi:hypothetical protein LTR10_000709 [Elasticomyces elasticus]|nr:hypothetical protein LTR10_000709 [Elasticomyces elasticus]